MFLGLALVRRAGSHVDPHLLAADHAQPQRHHGHVLQVSAHDRHAHAQNHLEPTQHDQRKWKRVKKRKRRLRRKKKNSKKTIKLNQRKSRPVRKKRNQRVLPALHRRIIDHPTKSRNSLIHRSNSPPRPRHPLPRHHPLRSNKRKKSRKRKRSRRLYQNPRKRQAAATANTRRHHPRLKESGRQRGRRKLTPLKIGERNENEVSHQGIGEESPEMSHFPPDEEGETIHARPPHPDEKEESFPVRLLPEDGAKRDVLLLLEGGEKQNIRNHHLPGKGDDDLSHRRHEVESVERKEYLPRHCEDAVGQVRHLL